MSSPLSERGPLAWWHKQSAAMRLAAAYVAILMVLSIVFSIVLYHFAVGQLARGLSHQFEQAGGGPPPNTPFDPSHIPAQVKANLDSGRHSLIISLVYFDAIIFLVGSLLSYWLARRTVRPIEVALEAQSRFTADASHELRTPLAVMQTEIETARTDPDLSRADAIELLDSNLEEVKKLHALADGLLRLARSDAKPIKLAATSLEPVITSALGRVAAAAKHSRVTIVNDTTGASVIADSEGLTELITILLDNAIKYSPAGATVKLSSGNHGHAQSISVIDHGRGIPAADLPHIFERFYRADRSRTKDDVEGHGLGLSLAHKLAELHHAEISVTSTTGQGSTFTIKLRAA